MSKRSQQLGAAFERRIQSEAHQGLGVWIKIPTSRAIDGRHVGKTWVDYVGISPQGKAITADAKWLGEKSTLPKSTLTKDQQRWMEQAYQSGALVAVLVGAVLNGTAEVCVVPWATLRERSSAPLVAAADGNWVEALLEVPCRA